MLHIILTGNGKTRPGVNERPESKGVKITEGSLIKRMTGHSSVSRPPVDVIKRIFPILVFLKVH